jgi:predicted GNAT family acetyltransferase
VGSLLRRDGDDDRSVADPADLRVAAIGEVHRSALTALVEADPLVNVVAASRMWATWSLEPTVFGGRLFGAWAADGTLTGAVLSAGNLLPIGGGPAEWTALAGLVVTGRRDCSSIVGRADAVATIWPVLEPSWGPARAIRPAQPLLVLDRDHAPGATDPRVRAMRMTDLDRYLPAAAAMFTEELGVAPRQATSIGEYRRRITGLIAAGRAFGIVDEAGEVIFKADIGAVSGRTCQVQGVWTRPDLRGRGIARAALAEVLRHALTLAPTVSLYVNDFNAPARRVYERLGMTETAVLSTVLF